jgi:hypothetical protein
MDALAAAASADAAAFLGWALAAEVFAREQAAEHPATIVPMPLSGGQIEEAMSRAWAERNVDCADFIQAGNDAAAGRPRKPTAQSMLSCVVAMWAAPSRAEAARLGGSTVDGALQLLLDQVNAGHRVLGAA